ncbi:MAG: transcription termination/antitermination protein NusG [Legionellales bacterium]|nr:transcription termination/antitermination protein NusG [Legionellales bacterium]
MDFSWYVLRAATGYEQRVYDSLKELISNEGLEKKVLDVAVPSEEVVEISGGKKRRSKRKFFPGYVLIHMCIDEDVWYKIRTLPHVYGFVGGRKDKPAPISQMEVDRIFNKVEQSVAKPMPKTLYEIGEMVRVVDGPFSDFDGVVEEVNYEKSRLKVSMLIFGSSTPVELDFSQVDKAT